MARREMRRASMRTLGMRVRIMQRNEAKYKVGANAFTASTDDEDEDDKDDEEEDTEDDDDDDEDKDEGVDEEEDEDSKVAGSQPRSIAAALFVLAYVTSSSWKER
jgi:hypothetical protein